ncbi:neuronal regeneration-related protein [Dendrobates tinctorius]|uniref:neuronal regeneration-related protein n=1 Tax=Dendrobates tinctorius TaxID=92724 RepID=UPI003CCA2ADD
MHKKGQAALGRPRPGCLTRPLLLQVSDYSMPPPSPGSQPRLCSGLARVHDWLLTNAFSVSVRQPPVLIVLLVVMAIMQPPHCCQVVSVVYHPHIAIFGTEDPSETKLMDGRFLEETLHLSKGVDRKENNGADSLLTPENGCGHHFTEINYLFLF